MIKVHNFCYHASTSTKNNLTNVNSEIWICKTKGKLWNNSTTNKLHRYWKMYMQWLHITQSRNSQLLTFYLFIYFWENQLPWKAAATMNKIKSEMIKSRGNSRFCILILPKHSGWDKILDSRKWLPGKIIKLVCPTFNGKEKGKKRRQFFMASKLSNRCLVMFSNQKWILLLHM